MRHKLETYPIGESPGPSILTLMQPGKELRIGNAVRNRVEEKSIFSWSSLI